jgi:hypothetical protein
VFKRVCKLGLEGIVSKRIDLPAWPIKKLVEGQEQETSGDASRAGGIRVRTAAGRMTDRYISPVSYARRLNWCLLF